MGEGSLGYASRLSYRAELGGELGAPEQAVSADTSDKQARELADLIRSSQHLVAFTGAGISTSSGIPDFRGPDGVWTKQRQGEPLPKASVPFEHACPSYTHQALLALQRAGRLHYLVSQNVDSLHLRSGFPRGSIAELHGNCFAERCETCGAEYVRDFEVGSVGFKPTGRRCAKDGCRGALRDHCLDWDNALPEDELAAAERHAAKADLVLCLGTSMVITPACDIPLRALFKRKHKPSGGKLVIVNLQSTPKDGKAALVIHAKVDGVMRVVMRELGVPMPSYIRTDSVLVSHALERKLLSSRLGSTAVLTLSLGSVHGEGCPLPWLASATVSLAHAAEGAAPAMMCGPRWRLELPCDVDCAHSPPLWVAEIKLALAEGTNAPPATLTYRFDPRHSSRRLKQPKDAACSSRFDLVTCRVDYGGAGGGEAGGVEASGAPLGAAAAAAASRPPPKRSASSLR
jgi:mono-ADP-ribosyltransferase sirtuin 6